MARPRKDSRPQDFDMGLALRRAAEEEFAARGFDGARLEDIAARVGLTRSSLLHHYPTKALLHAAVLGAFFERIRGALVAGMTTRGSFADRLSETAGGFAQAMCEDPVPARLLVRELQDGGPAGARQVRDQMLPLVELVEAFLRQQGGASLRDDLDLRAAIADLVGSVVFCVISGPLRADLWGGPDGAESEAVDVHRHFAKAARELFLVPAAHRRYRSAP